jgi:hypothetical protein
MPQRNTRLALSRETPFDPLEIMELPDFNAERQSARRKFIQPGHFSEVILFDIASTVEGGGYVFWAEYQPRRGVFVFVSR